MGKLQERGVKRVKKTVAILLAALLLTALAAPAYALSMPETLNVPTGVAAENFLAEEYQYRTLIYFTLADDIIEVMSTEPSRYKALTLEGKLYLQFSIDGGSWVSFYFTGADDEGNEVQRVYKKLTLTRKNSVSVLNLVREQDRAQLPEDVYFYDPEYPQNSYLKTDAHEFRFRVRVELEYIDKADLKTKSVTSPWSKAATASTVVTEETLPSVLRLPVIASAEPRDGASGAELAVSVKPPMQVTLVDNFLRENGGAVELQAQASVNEGEWVDMPASESAVGAAVFNVPQSLGPETASAVKTSNFRVRFRYAAKGRELASDWTEATAVGEYIEQSRNPEFSAPSFLMNEFLGLKVWIWMLAGIVILLAVISAAIVRGRRY